MYYYSFQIFLCSEQVYLLVDFLQTFGLFLGTVSKTDVCPCTYFLESGSNSLSDMFNALLCCFRSDLVRNQLFGLRIGVNVICFSSLLNTQLCGLAMASPSSLLCNIPNMVSAIWLRRIWRKGGGGGRLEPLASVNNILLDLHNSLHPTQPHSIIAKC